MSLQDSLDVFRQGISESNNFISIAFEVDSDGNYIFDEPKRDFVITSSFLKMFIYWEQFLEDVFAKYLCGEPAIGGTNVVTFLNLNDREHALKVLIGTQKYVDWANHEIVRRLANLYLEDGEPLQSNISAIASELADLKTIRNAAAHTSSTTQTKLDALASRLLTRAVSNISVSRLIVALDPLEQNQTLLQRYQKILDVAAENIANNQV